MYKKHTVFGDSHLVLAHVCSNHPFVTDRDQEMDESCNCRNLWPHQICNFCFWVRFLFNFTAAKLCVKKISENMQFFILSVDNMSAFFHYHSNARRVQISFDIPSIPNAKYLQTG